MTTTNKFLLLFFFTFFAMAVTAPLASFHYVPAGDFFDHAKSIVLAKDALLQNQFPIRVAPGLPNAPGYALFQFYSPLPYMLAGFIYKLHFIHNACIPYKILTWLALIFGGIYMYRLVNLLLKQPAIALLAGLAYQFSPYWIINTDIRTDFTESLAQGLLPIVLFYSVSILQKPQARQFIITAMLWAALAMTHLVTFAYASLFFLIFATLVTYQQKNLFKNFLCLLAAFVFSYLLALWYLAPVVLYHHILNITPNDLQSPAWSNIFTPLANLFATQSISPLPLPAGNELGCDFLYPALGYPVMLGVGILIYALGKDREYFKKHTLLLPLLVTFALAFFATWSPFNFWQYLPHFLSFFQYTYRFLAQVSWLGVLLFAYALAWLAKDNLDEPKVLLVLCFIVIGNSLWLHSQKNNDVSAAEIEKSYKMLNAQAYQVTPSAVAKNHLVNNSHLLTDCKNEKSALVCEVQVTKTQENVTLPMLWYPNMLNVTVDQQPTNYSPTQEGSTIKVAVALAKGAHTISANFVGLAWANTLSAASWMMAFMGIAILSWRSRSVERRLAKVPA